jgi:SAM-dependent methyltransferase
MGAVYAQHAGTATLLGSPVLLDIGIGAHPMVGAIGIDLRILPGTSIVADAVGRLPFSDCSVDGIRASHVVEHVTDPLSFFREAWRVLRPGGSLYVITPHFSCPVSVWGDPTHHRPFGTGSFQYLEADALGSYANDFDFRVVSTYLRRRPEQTSGLSVLLERLANRSPVGRARAETYWAALTGGFVEIHALLTAVK